jgi:hypothetical protein
MEKYDASRLWTFIFVFLLLSAFIWLTSFIPALKVAVKKGQDMLFMFVDEPIVGLALFGVILLIYFGIYYTAPLPLDLGQKYISQFTNIWVIFMTLVILLAMFTVKRSK